MVITPENFFPLLKASEFLKLNDYNYFEHICVEFVLKYTPLPNALDAYLFVCTTKLSRITRTLSLYLTKPLKKFFKTDEFLEIPFDIFRVILKLWVSTSRDALVKAIIRWVSFSREERVHHFAEIVSLNPFKNISSAYVQILVEKLITDTEDVTALTRVDESVTINRCHDATKNLLHIFVVGADSQLPSRNEEDLYGRVYSVTPRQNCYLHCNIFDSMVEHFRITVVNDTYLYSLSSVANDYFRTFDFEDQFWRCTSVDMHSKIDLTLPPVIMPADFHLMSVQNHEGIFLLSSSPIRRPSTTLLFSDEEIYRRVYYYNCPRNTWFPVPATQEDLRSNCAATLDSRLYVAGRLKSDRRNSLQTYDCRAAMWDILPTSEFIPQAMAALDGKIYVTSAARALDENTRCARFDPVAGKWEEVESMNVQLKMPHRLIPYSNQLWALNFDEPCFCRKLHNFFVEIYDPKTEKWSHSPRLTEAFIDERDFPYLKITEAVVFKDLSS